MKKYIEKRQIGVLIGNSEPNFDHMLSAIIRRRLGNKYDISFTSASTDDELLKIAKENAFYIFILIPNNIMFRRKNLTLKERGRKVLEIIAHLRATYGKPIIAASALWRKDTSFAKKARLAGVSSYFDLPFDMDEFLDTLGSLLGIEPRDTDDR